MNTEKSALKNAMLDGSLSIPEITGFVSRFITQMDTINVGVDYEIAWYGRYPGVHLTITANGSEREYKIYRSNRNTWIFSYLPETIDDYYYYETDNGIIITGLNKDEAYRSALTELTIPAVIDGKSVYGLEGNEYYGENIKSLTLSEGIKWIGEATFMGCDTLTTLNLPSSLETICDYAFDDCENLKDVTVGSNLMYMGDAFNDTKVGVESTISFGEKLQHLGRVFENMTIASSNPYFTLDSGAIYENNTNTLIYYSPSKTVSKYTVLDGTVTILACGNSYTKTVVLPESVRVIEDEAFAECTALTSITLNEGLVYIGMEAFYGCSALKSINLPSTLINLVDCALDGCASITELTISSPLEHLEEPGYMKKLTSITFTQIIEDRYKWRNICPDPSAITVYDYTLPNETQGAYSEWAEDSGFKYVHVSQGTGNVSGAFTTHEITVTLGDLFVLNAEVDGATENIVVSSQNATITNIANLSNEPTKNVFIAAAVGTSTISLSNLSSEGRTILDTCTVTVKDTSARLTLPSGIKKVDSYTFMSTNARIVVIPEGVTTISDHAFMNCSSLSIVYLPSTITSIDKTAFTGCGTFALVFLTYEMYDEMYDEFELNNCDVVETFID